MKSTFSICKILILCFFVSCGFSSCSSYLLVDGKKVPKKVTIHVTGYNIGNGDLTLADDSAKPADPFQAFPGQKIRWKLTDPRNHRIDSVYPKPTNQNAVFADTPHTVWLSKSWKGILKDKAAMQQNAVKDSVGTINYVYKIVWDTAGAQRTFDPRIQIK